MSLLARAKINLFLHVTGKRPDGYHTLQSLVAFADSGDAVHAAASPTLLLRITGPQSHGLEADDNLVMKAARLLQQRHGVASGAVLTLDKHLPIGSGIGGGSADAAATLHALNSLWKLNLGIQQLQALGLELGADVPVCVASTPMLMEGIGEQLTPVALPQLHAVLVNPLISLPTRDVFNALTRADNAVARTPASFANTAELIGFLRTTRNDLQEPACALQPAVARQLQALTQSGAGLARMSGSGATCFGLYETKEAADTAAASISSEYPTWWVTPTRLS